MIRSSSTCAQIRNLAAVRSWYSGHFARCSFISSRFLVICSSATVLSIGTHLDLMNSSAYFDSLRMIASILG